MIHFEQINDLNNHYGIGESKHPLIDIRKYSNAHPISNEPVKLDFYKIGIKKNFKGFVQYGKTKYDSTKGVMYFLEPNQIFSWASEETWDGYHIFIHPDIYKKNYAVKNIKSYNFFSYQVNEALFLTETEKDRIEFLIDEALFELNKEDKFSVPIVLSYINTLLNIIERFYERQFDTRKPIYNQLTTNFLQLLKKYYSNERNYKTQPSVFFFAEELNITPRYLSDIIKSNTGKSALTIIHDHIVEEAKILLVNSQKSVSEISFMLGFDYPNYFSRLFKKKTKLSPSDYRISLKSI